MASALTAAIPDAHGTIADGEGKVVGRFYTAEVSWYSPYEIPENIRKFQAIVFVKMPDLADKAVPDADYGITNIDGCCR